MGTLTHQVPATKKGQHRKSAPRAQGSLVHELVIEPVLHNEPAARPDMQAEIHIETLLRSTAEGNTSNPMVGDDAVSAVGEAASGRTPPPEFESIWLHRYSSHGMNPDKFKE